MLAFWISLSFFLSSDFCEEPENCLKIRIELGLLDWLLNWDCSWSFRLSMWTIDSLIVAVGAWMLAIDDCGVLLPAAVEWSASGELFYRMKFLIFVSEKKWNINFSYDPILYYCKNFVWLFINLIVFFFWYFFLLFVLLKT